MQLVDVTVQAVQHLATRAELVKLLAGHDLFTQRSPAGNCIFVLQAG